MAGFFGVLAIIQGLVAIIMAPKVNRVANIVVGLVLVGVGMALLK